MAISFSQEEGFSWKSIIGFVIIFLIIVIGAYFLFFAPVPGIDVIAPASVRTTAELSEIEFSPESVVNGEDFRALRKYTGQASIGQVGRINPFIAY
ncbi:hypothetical protein GW950_01560 [Candidatus Wolfebacteria bacterium]|nr:hypothetical protein [Candidatus Wolfebacteria bacterium]